MNLVDIIVAVGGLILGGIITWVVARAFYLRQKRDADTQRQAAERDTQNVQERLETVQARFKVLDKERRNYSWGAVLEGC
jgi:hypothetical protein